MIEISKGKLAKSYRVNPFNPRCVDVRENKSGKRWEHLKSFNTTMEAIEYLMQLERKPKDGGK